VKDRGGLPVVRSVTKYSRKGRRQTSRTFYFKSDASHIWASQRGETRMKVPLDVSSFFTTLLRRAIGGKAYARGKSYLWDKASTPSGLSKAFQL
jgi:hypothetical protein